MSVVLEDQRILGELCGVNDSNLKAIEELIGARVLSRGNELVLDSNDASKWTLFRKLVSELEELVRGGQIPGRSSIRSLYESLQKNKKPAEQAQKNQIVFPSGVKVFPRSEKQAAYVRTMGMHDLVFCIGPAGTGKTYLAVAHALHGIITKKKKKLLLTRPVVEAGESLGYLPGDLTQKISPYLRPLYDAMDAFINYEMIARLEEKRIIEIAPLAYMRGRSLRDAYIILDEAQNTTKEQMKMFLTRLGEGAQAIVTGDVTQIDLDDRKQSGLLHARKILRHLEEIGVVEFTAQDVVRHPLVQRIVQAYESQQS